MKTLFLLSLLFGSLHAQDAQTGPDEYLNVEAEYICLRIAESEIPIESLTARGAGTLRAKQGQGLEAASAGMYHMKKLEAKGIEGFAYDGYVNLYLSLLCPDYNRLFAVENVKYIDDKLKHKRFVELHNFMRDLMLADSTQELQDYIAPAFWGTIEPLLHSERSNLQELRWTGSLEVIAIMRETGHFRIHLTDIDDTNHIFGFDVQYGADRDSKITELTLNEYTKERPIPKDTVETEEVVPFGY
ncbi:hypothetical protein O3Q51_06940 [Cryomorphaceae bacterium 1068]|nr:hypothetical protein [Cryomorphaceae bacterium 1068]